MPRSRSSRASRPAMRPATAPAPVVRQAPAPAPAPPAQYQQRRTGIGSTVAEGMAFGGGSAVAHRAVDAVVGPRTVMQEHVQGTQNPTTAPGSGVQSQEFDACVNQAKAFKDCLSFNADDIGKCQFYLDVLNECRKSVGAAPQSPSWS